VEEEKSGGHALNSFLPLSENAISQR